jgi:hypothetical protein
MFRANFKRKIKIWQAFINELKKLRIERKQSPFGFAVLLSNWCRVQLAARRLFF